MIHKEDPRYARGAYFFLRRGLDHTLKGIAKKEQSRNTRHVSGHELLEGLRDYALNEYGPMAMTLLRHWGVRSCEDIGEMVFNLVEYGVFGKTDNDRREDFANAFDFQDAFVRPYRPKRLAPPPTDFLEEAERPPADVHPDRN